MVVGALDTEVSIDKDEESDEPGRTPVKIRCTKQKHAQQFAEIQGVIESVAGTSSAALRVTDPLDEGRRTGKATDARERIARQVFIDGNMTLSGTSLDKVRKKLRASKTNPHGVHHTTINREWGKFVSGGHLLSADHSRVVVAPEEAAKGSRGDDVGTVGTTDHLHVVLAPGIIQELGLENS